MRLVIALGGNALLKRGESLTAENQRRNMQAAAGGLARACAGNEVAIVHGNGPQVGLLALEAEAYGAVPAYPLDVLSAESQGMIGYVVAQELRNAITPRRVACLLTQTLVDADDPAFGQPTKPIGPVYLSLEAAKQASRPGWTFAPDGHGFRRVVPSPRPTSIVEFEEIAGLVDRRVVTICCGGGGIAVTGVDSRLTGVEAVVDKDWTAALLAARLEADRFVILTDVDAVYARWGEPEQEPIREIRPKDLRSLALAEGSMRPKVEAALQFAHATGNPAMIGALDDIGSLLDGSAGTRIFA